MDPLLRDFVQEIHAGTNYGAVDECIIRSLFERYYADQVAGRDRLVVENLSRLAGVEDEEGGLKLTLAAPRGAGWRVLDVDYLVCATGYDAIPPYGVLSHELRDLLVRDAGGSPVIERDYRLRTHARLCAPIYLQGGNEASHGLSATLLSNLAPRTGEIRDSIVAYVAASAADCVSAAGSRFPYR